MPLMPVPVPGRRCVSPNQEGGPDSPFFPVGMFHLGISLSFRMVRPLSQRPRCKVQGVWGEDMSRYRSLGE